MNSLFRPFQSVMYGGGGTGGRREGRVGDGGRWGGGGGWGVEGGGGWLVDTSNAKMEEKLFSISPSIRRKRISGGSRLFFFLLPLLLLFLLLFHLFLQLLLLLLFLVTFVRNPANLFLIWRWLAQGSFETQTGNLFESRLRLIRPSARTEQERAGERAWAE